MSNRKEKQIREQLEAKLAVIDSRRSRNADARSRPDARARPGNRRVVEHRARLEILQRNFFADVNLVRPPNIHAAVAQLRDAQRVASFVVKSFVHRKGAQSPAPLG